MQPLNVLSLFDGMSCGQIALGKANIPVDTYFASEIDKHAIKVTQSNYPGTKQLGCVTGVTTASVGKRVDVLMAGSPCQGFSMLGDGLNFHDPRSKLYFDFLRIKEELEPKYWLLENVRMQQSWQDVITGHLGVEPIFINSSLVSAQSRPRLYWTNIPNVTQPEDAYWYCEDVIDKTNQTPNSPGWQDWWQRNKEVRLKKQYSGIMNDREKAICCIANHRRNWDGNLVRLESGLLRFADRYELEELQTVPFGYTDCVSIAQAYKLLGNGWTVDVIAHILKNISTPRLT